MGETFQRTTIAPRVNENDARLAAAREADAAARLTPAESGILYDSLTPEQKNAMQLEALGHNTGATRTMLNPETGQMETVRLGVQRGYSSTPKPGAEGILAAARTASGRSLGDWGEATDASIFTVDGVTLPASTASRLGLIVKKGDGSYGPAVAPTPEQLAAAAEAKAAEDDGIVTEHLTPAFREAVQELGARTGGGEAGARAAISSVIIQGVDGDLDTAAKSLSTRIGADPAYSREVIENAIANGTASAAAYISRTFPGVPGEAVIAHASTVGTKAERASRINRVVLGDKRVFQEMVADWRKAERAQAHPIK